MRLRADGEGRFSSVEAPDLVSTVACGAWFFNGDGG